jgi:hypothetical protein
MLYSLGKAECNAREDSNGIHGVVIYLRYFY